MDGPPPWDMGAPAHDLFAPLPDWLDDACRSLNQTYAWQSQQVIPPCWKEQDRLPYEIAVWPRAAADAEAPVARERLVGPS